MKKGKFFFVENRKNEQAEYQIFVLYPEKMKNEQIELMYEKLCRAIGNVKTKVYASRIEPNEKGIPEGKHKELLNQELSYLPEEAYVIINKFIVK